MGGKVRYHKLSELEKKKYLGDFYKIAAALNGYDETKNFFKDLLTLSETVMIARRIQIAKMLLNDIGYDDIRKELGVGFSTINHVDRWLNNGFGGYRKALQKFSNDKKSIHRLVDKIPAAPYSLDNVRKKYPLHFLLLNLLMDNKK